MRTLRVGWMGLVAVLLLAAAAEGQQHNFEAEEWFEKGLVHYNKGLFTGARSDFQHILSLPRNQRSSAAQFMVAKCFYKLEEYDKAIREAEVLPEEYPQTRYVPDAQMLIGDCWFRKGEPLKAGELYVSVLEDPTVPIALEERAAHRVLLIASGLPNEQLPYLSAYFENRKMEEILLYKGAETDLRRGEVAGARSKLEAFLKRFPGSPFSTRARELLLEREPEKADSETVGCLCPLSGADAQAGRDLRDGVRLAQEQFGSRISVDFEDTKSDVIGAIKATQKLVRERGVIAIIGPVSGPETVAAAAVADCEQTPLLAPTATDDMLTYVGPSIFQLNTTPMIQGINIADYAVNQLGLYRLAVLASTDPYGSHMASGFVEQVDRQGGYVLVKEVFFPGTKDFSAQLDQIERAAQQLRQSQPQNREMGTSENAPLAAVDGILVAADSDAIPLIASQLATRNMKAQLLGGNGWYSDKAVRDGGKYVEGAVFAAEYYEGAQPYVQFTKAFTDRFGRRPTKVAAFGYDAMMLINRVYAQSQARTPTGIRDYLGRVTDFVGASGAISFERGHANSRCYILQIKKGRITPAEAPD